MRRERLYDVYDDTRIPGQPIQQQQVDERTWPMERSRVERQVDRRYAEPPAAYGDLGVFPGESGHPFDSFFGPDPFFEDMRMQTRNLMRGMDNMFASFDTAARNGGGQMQGSYSFQSSSSVFGPDGVREESVHTFPGPDGRPSTKRVIRNPDGSEHVTVLRDELPPEFQHGFGHPGMTPTFGVPRVTQGYNPRTPPQPEYDPPRIEELPDGEDYGSDRPGSASGVRTDAAQHRDNRRMWDREFWNPRGRQ
jgi:hypothetical protein